MQGTDSKIWERIFGEAWDAVAKICPEVGAFLINHREKTVILDENAQRLSELNYTPDYEAMMEYLDLLVSSPKAFSRLAPQVAYQDDDYTAGILRWHYDFSGVQAKMVIPVLEPSQFSLALKQCAESSLLALLELNISDHSELSESQLFGALAAIARAMPDDTVFCPSHKNCFWIFIPSLEGNAEETLKNAQRFVAESGQAARLGEINTDRYITFTAGIASEQGQPDQRMRAAQFALYEAHLIGEGTILNYSSEQYEMNKEEYGKMSKFLKLVNENLFQYHFQPIVSAKNGELIAYEMLMRTDSSIGMFPLEILDCADKAKRLYDIEKATISNALSIIEKNQDVFKKRKLFVNSITAHMLTDEDWEELRNRYGELTEKMVIEFTEQSELDVERIGNVKDRFVRANTKLAIDDFGTGYSNTMNLIRYNPDFVKIDRSLISGIDTKPTLRKLVSGIIEFIHENGYQALAEGVETYEELQVMIQLGSDLIQGYYVSKPIPIMLHDVSDSVCRDIETINLQNSDGIARPYHPSEGEVVDLCMVRGDRYHSVFIETENVTLKGRSDIFLDIPIRIKDGLRCVVTLENVRIKTDKETPIVSLGDGSDVEIILTGKNDFEGGGIYVPSRSAVYIIGDDGSELNIKHGRSDCVAIGVDSKNSHGKITIDTRGKINIRATGDVVTAIGGGKNERKNQIRILGGELNISCNGGSCIGIGNTDGGSIIDVENSCVSVELNAPDVVGIGSIRGSVDIAMKKFTLKQDLGGVSILGVGALEAGSGMIDMDDGVIEASYKGRRVSCIGTRGGNVTVFLKRSFVNMYCEGGVVVGFGDMLGAGGVGISETRLDVEIRSGHPVPFASKTGRIVRRDNDEDIKINP